jgi:hypothetical protein
MYAKYYNCICNNCLTAQRFSKLNVIDKSFAPFIPKNLCWVCGNELQEKNIIGPETALAAPVHPVVPMLLSGCALSEHFRIVKIYECVCKNCSSTQKFKKFLQENHLPKKISMQNLCQKCGCELKEPQITNCQQWEEGYLNPDGSVFYSCQVSRGGCAGCSFGS